MRTDPMLLSVSHWPSAAGDVSSIAGRVTKVHAPQLLKATSPRAGMPLQEKPPQREARAPELERSLASTTRERLHAATKTQYSQKHKRFKKGAGGCALSSLKNRKKNPLKFWGW